MESIQLSFERKVQPCADFYVIGISFGYCELYFQGGELGEFGYNGRGRSVCSYADLPQADNSVKGSAKLCLCNIGLYQVDVGIQGRQFGLYLFVRFLTDRISFQQGILTEYAVFRQLQLRYQPLQLRLKRTIVHFSEQLPFLHETAFFKVDFDNLAGCLE